jgi:hypothetical protein
LLLKRQITKLGVDIKMAKGSSSEVSKKPEVVIIVSGGSPVLPDIPG